MFVAGIGTFIARILPGSNSKDWVDELADGLISDDTAEAVGGFSSASPLIACGAESDACQLTQGKPEAGALYIDESLLPASRVISVGDPITFKLPYANACDGNRSNLRVTFKWGEYDLPMEMSADGSYSITVDAIAAGYPIIVTVEDLSRDTIIERQLWQGLPRIENPDQPYDACSLYQNPSVHGELLYMDRNPTEIYVGDEVRIYFPSQDIFQCDGTTGADDGNRLVVTFTVETPIGRVTLHAINDGTDFYFPYPFTEEGRHSISISEVRDEGRLISNTDPWSLPSTGEFYVSRSDTDTLCGETSNRPRIVSFGIDPDRSELDPAGRVLYNDDVTFYAVTSDCDLDEASLDVTLYANPTPTIMTLESEIPGGYRIYSSTVPAQYFGTPVTITVVDTLRETSSTSQLWSLPPIIARGGFLPSATISSNLEHNLHLGIDGTVVVSPVTCHSDDLGATFEWTVTRPGPNAFGEIVENFAGDSIPTYTFDLEGTFFFRCVVTAGDGVTQSSASRNVEVWPVDLELPPGAIEGPHAAEVGETFTYTVPSFDTTLYSYTWEITDGFSSPGPSVSHAIASPGTYQVRLTIAYLSNPEIHTHLSQNITIVPISIDVPAFELNIPYAAGQNASVPMSIAGDLSAWTVSWDYGEGGTLGSGASVSNIYEASGKYQVVVTLTSTIDPSYRIEVPFIITIVPPGDPVPNLAVTPGMGRAPLSVTADARTSYATASGASILEYIFNWGDGTAEDHVTAGSTIGHTYSCSGPGSCSYTVRVTVVDSNGRTSTISATVSTWP